LWSFRALASRQYFRIADGAFLGLPGRLFFNIQVGLLMEKYYFQRKPKSLRSAKVELIEKQISTLTYFSSVGVG
jgi:hypothetical protein